MTFFWHRRDLRKFDNAGLYQALKNERDVQPVFIFDWNILDQLDDSKDARVKFIYEHIRRLKKEYQEAGSDLWVFYGKPENVWEELVREHNISTVYTNRDYEPYAKKRDQKLFDFFKKNDIVFKGYKDHVIFDKDEVLKDDGNPYVVFSPYAKKWREKLNDYFLKSYPVEKYFTNLHQVEVKQPLLSLYELGFKELDFSYPSKGVENQILKNYKEKRDFPAAEGTSRISVHLRFGTISIRQLATKARELSGSYLNELIWRDFYQMIIHHFPHSAENAFKEKYDLIEWEKNEEHFNAWCEGKTGYPIVDAGMRELNETGFMHNRVRMITASFLTKHLLLDWRWGEAYFAKKLLDYELASNVGGWQWAAGSGCDAAPYFRVFNPYLQEKKFDKEFKYIKRWVPEINTEEYPDPIVEHKFARERALDRYKKGLNK